MSGASSSGGATGASEGAEAGREGSSSSGQGAADAAADSGASASDAAPDGSSPSFSLSWQDDFNTLDLSVWQLQTFTFAGNAAQFSTQNAAVANGVLTLQLTPNPQCTTSVAPTPDPLVVNLALDAETAFHQYDIEWTPTGVTTSVDGKVLRTWTKYISLLNLPQTILLTIWASAASGWAGALQPDSAPTSADINWIRVYDWHP